MKDYGKDIMKPKMDWASGKSDEAGIADVTMDDVRQTLAHYNGTVSETTARLLFKQVMHIHESRNKRDDTVIEDVWDVLLANLEKNSAREKRLSLIARLNNSQTTLSPTDQFMKLCWGIYSMMELPEETVSKTVSNQHVF